MGDCSRQEEKRTAREESVFGRDADSVQEEDGDCFAAAAGVCQRRGRALKKKVAGYKGVAL